MRIIMEWGYDLREGTAQDYQRWLEDNEAEIAKSCPEGIEYLGTYTAIYSDQREAGAYRTMWQLDSYGAQDRFAEEMAGDTRLAALLHEATTFGDFRNGARGSQQLLKAVVDATIWEPTAD
jgi:hypothetical protein